MKKLLSILLVLSMMISLCAAFSTVSFAEEETEETTTEVAEYNGSELGFTAEVFADDVSGKGRVHVGQPSGFDSGMSPTAFKWLYDNGYYGNDAVNKTYYLTSDSEGGYTIGTSNNSTNDKYTIQNLNTLVTQNSGQKIMGGIYVTSYKNGEDTVIVKKSFPINHFPIDIDVNLNGERTVSGLRIYNNGESGYVTEYEVYVKFSSDGDYLYITEGTNSDKTKFDVDFGANYKIVGVRVRCLKGAATVNQEGWGAAKGETAYVSMRYIAALGENSSYSEGNEKTLIDNMLDTRVIGSLENKKSIEKAEEMYKNNDYVAQHRANYKQKEVKEVETTFGTVTATSPHKYRDGSNTSEWDANAAIAGLKNLTDGYVTDDYSGGVGYYAYGDYCVYPNSQQYLTIELPITKTEDFTGIRFYSRKADENWINYQNTNSPEKVVVTLYGKDNATYVTSAVIIAEKGEKGVYKASEDTSTSKTDDAKSYKEDIDYRYVDIKLAFNDKKVRVTDISKIKVEIRGLFNNGNHWGAEEIRLINDSTVTGNAKTVAEIAEASVTSKEIVADTGVLDGKGIIRFITEFEKIADGAEIEYFGTYVINNSRYSSGSVEFSGGNVGKYEVGTGEGQYSAPEVGNTFSVDVKDIKNENFNVQVTAVSFVKIAGYENPIILNVKQGVTVDGSRNVKLPANETAGTTTGTEE